MYQLLGRIVANLSGMVKEAVERPDLVERALPFLPPDGRIRQIFICQTAPYFWLFVVNYLTFLTIFWIRFRCVAVADEGIYVLESTKFSGGAKPQSIVGVLPRQTKLGPVSGVWGEIELLGQRHWVHKRFHHLIDAADRDAGFDAPAPE
ncbi:hypothetical protein ACIA58_23405 [Kribbella sp. NPDC051586]|uniref:hypothetical protein n=1 Tax=Kribbella sp. NPDC051586 TaxID=3364118 RepID=UPI0037958615